MKLLIVLGTILLLKSEETKGADWSYHGAHGPANWKDDYGDCDNMKQSPINIVPSDARYDSNLNQFTLVGFGQAGTHTLKNNGHTVQVDVTGNMDVTGGGLVGTYRVAQFHFHWGPDKNSGSEHTLNGKKYPLEVHIVTYNTKYVFVDALDKDDGLAVLGFFFEESELTNCHYEGLAGLLEDVKYKGSNTSVTNTSLLQFIAYASRNRYYRYKGSLTTPPCYESVTWTVFEDTIKLSSAQFAKFRNVYEDSGSVKIDENFRPLQKLNGRTVTANFYTGVSAGNNVAYHLGLLFSMLSFAFSILH